MRVLILTLLHCVPTLLSGSVDPLALRRQVFGEYEHTTDVNVYVFGHNQLAIFGNGYVLTQEEYNYAWNRTKRDSSAAAKAKFLDDMMLLYQKTFEGMELGLDTSTSFQLEFLKYKQEKLTPYLNQGYSRVEAEALPEFKYFIRQYYGGMIVFELMNSQVWMKANMDNVALRNYYNEHLSLYQGQSFEVARSKVVYDYQKELEKQLDERVRQKFPCKANTELKNKL